MPVLPLFHREFDRPYYKQDLRIFYPNVPEAGMMHDNNDYDVIVVGGGGAGMAAAITAADAGASVALVEAGQRLGGSTALSGGVYYAAGTSVQRARGITDDSADAMFEYYMTLNQHRVEASLVRRLCDRAADGLEWLAGFGVEFPPEELYSSGVESALRGHQPFGHGAAIAAALDREVSRRPAIDVALDSRVDELLADDKRIRGIRLGDDTVTAPAVVIATGGFGANRYLYHRYYPEAAAQGQRAWYIGSEHCRGDGLTMGEAIGADIVGHNRGLLLTTPDFRRELEVFVPGWLVYVNREGRRFIDETTEYAVMSGAVKAQTGGSCFAIFDDAARRTARPDPAHADAFAAGLVAYNWVTEVLDEQIAAGKVMRADNLDTLAEEAGLRPGSVNRTVQTYNQDCADGRDSMFFKDGAVMKPVATPPFYAVEIHAAIVCLTSTGLRIDTEARVLDQLDRPIDGLFAAGETTGGVLGERYVGGGNSITNAIVFGRIAGASACATANDH